MNKIGFWISACALCVAGAAVQAQAVEAAKEKAADEAAADAQVVCRVSSHEEVAKCRKGQGFWFHPAIPGRVFASEFIALYCDQTRPMVHDEFGVFCTYAGVKKFVGGKK